jgi:hypothetical protein
VVLFESEVKWLHRELDEVTRGRNREFVRPLWSSVPDVEMGVGLELPTHRLMHMDVGKGLKKVWRSSPSCG